MGDQQAASASRMAFTGSVSDARFSPDGNHLYTIVGNVISDVDVATGTVLKRYTIGKTLNGMDISNDGRYLITAGRQDDGTSEVYRVDLLDGAVQAYTSDRFSPNPYAAGPVDVSFTADGNALVATGGFDQDLQALFHLDFSDGTFTDVANSQPGTLAASVDHQTILIEPRSPFYPSYVYQTGQGITAHVDAVEDPYAGASFTSNPGVLAISAAGDLIVQGGTLNIYDQNLNLKGRLAGFFGDISGMTFSADNHELYAVSGNTVAEYDMTTFQVTATFSINGVAAAPYDPTTGRTVGYGDILQIDSGGQTLSIITTTGVELLDLTHAVSTSGPGNDVLTGHGGLYGLGGNDILIGDGTASASMVGGSGDDTYYIGTPYDYVVETANNGYDTVFSRFDYYMPDNVEKLVLQGADSIGGFGNSLDNTIMGNVGNNLMLGYAGNDFIDGGDGNDTLIGGVGADTLYGDAGDDILAPGTGLDMIDGGSGFDTAKLDQSQSNYHVEIIGNDTYLVDADDNRVNVRNIEQVQFTDRTATWFDIVNNRAELLTPKAEIYRMYQTALGRVPDADGFAAWANELANGRTLASIAQAFTDSAEFQVKFASLNNRQFVNALYEQALGRKADAQGGDAYVKGLRNGSLTRADVVLSFAESSEQKNHTAAAVSAGLFTQSEPDVHAGIQLLYDAELGRTPDSYGLLAYEQEFAQGYSLKTIANQIAQSSEFANHYAGLGDQQFVEALYLSALHRFADPIGTAAYVDELRNGYSRGDVAYQIAGSTEHQALTGTHSSLFI